MAESKEQLEKRLQELQDNQKQAEATYHQVSGAIMLVQGMLEELEEGSKKDKKPKVNA